ncbi:MAG: OB-fold nucleic acid binding domain-containing protein, partial [Anaerolineae bacterium]
GLYDPGGSRADAVAWGKAPPAFTEGTPAPEMPKESSLERLPGGADGNFTDSDNNAADFALTTVPNPQTAAAPPAPLLPQRLDVRLDAPPTVEPGQSFAYTLTAQNLTGRDLTGLTIELPLPAGLTVESADGGGTQTGDGVTWAVPALPAGETAVRNVTVAAPWTVTAFRIDNYRAAGPDLPRPAYGPAVFTEVAGGTIPIGVARALPPGTAVTIEGTATMYTGGYYAGGGNTKFYLQDETGGIQVQVFGADGPLPGVALGDRVRVSGVTELYRDSLEIIPQTLPDDVEFTGAEPPLAPARRAIAEATADPNRAGEYVAITGRATRIEEFTYSYELDLLDDAGDTLMLYVDKLTNLTTDTLNEGSLYTVAGVLEYYQGRWQLKPRVPADFQEVFPPELRLEISAPNTAQPGDSLEYTLTVFNHTAAPLTGVVISSPIPAELDEVFDGGAVDGDAVRWEIPTLPPNGGSAGVRFAVIVPATGEQVVNDGYRATAAEWPAPVSGPPFRTFIGNTVPVWAVQGPGFKSPYANSSLQTE